MSHPQNDIFIENLFDRLESLAPALPLPDYADKQRDLLNLVCTNQLEEAGVAVLGWERANLGEALDVAEAAHEIY